jgi:bla regulator protein blaR1
LADRNFEIRCSDCNAYGYRHAARPLPPAGERLSFVTSYLNDLLSGVLSWLPSFPRVAPSSLALFLITLLWPLGTLLMLLRWARSSSQMSNLVPSSALEQNLFDGVRSRLRIKRQVRLFSSVSITEPMLAGLFRPRVCLPEGLSQRLNASELETVYLHELAHLKRHDNFTGAVVRGLLCLFWFHPLLWLAQARLLVERERACDQRVVRSGATAAAYISGIFKVCGFEVFEAIQGTCHMNGSDLKKRLDLIVSTHRPPVGNSLLHCLLVIAICLIGMMPVAGGYCEQCVSNAGIPAQSPAPCGSLFSIQASCK